MPLHGTASTKPARYRDRRLGIEAPPAGWDPLSTMWAPRWVAFADPAAERRDNYSVFLCEGRRLFGYLETEEFGRARAEMARREVNLRWQQEMAPFFEGLEGRRPDEGMVLLEEVFHLD